MSIEDYASLAGILSIVIGGANFIVIGLIRLFWRLTYDKKVAEDEKRFTKIEKELEVLRDCEDKNKYFRHNFDSVTKNLFNHISDQISHLRELIELKFEIMSKNDKKNKK